MEKYKYNIKNDFLFKSYTSFKQINKNEHRKR